jgi:hypothetical protein
MKGQKVKGRKIERPKITGPKKQKADFFMAENVIMQNFSAF